MAEKNKKDSKIATTPQKQLALTTSTMAIPPIELVNRYQVLNPTFCFAYVLVYATSMPCHHLIGLDIRIKSKKK